MFYWLHHLTDWYSPLRVFQYVTVRAFAGAGTAFLIVLLVGPRFIAALRAMKVGENVRKEEAPPLFLLHGSKQGTPTMGGILIVGAVVVSALLWTIPGNFPTLVCVTTLVYMGLVGFLDDYAKLRRKRSKGLTARGKFMLQILWAVALGCALLAHPVTAERTRQIMVPFFKVPVVTGMAVPVAVLFVTLVIVGAANAVNLTDGLDGLAIGCSGSAALSYAVMTYVAGHAAFAEYLRIPFISGGGELAVFCGCLLGACLGFLWFNCHPASVFMGDTGSLALGGAIAAVAILIKQEIALIVVGGVFVIEAVSVIIQVASFRLRGRRVFAMAPLHHHFQLKRWSETQVTIRFWILSIMFAILGILTLKLR